jgi:aryl-alcohol dehydrogenase-like predicted oxidoreductase
MSSLQEPFIALGSTDVRVSAVGVGTNSWGAKNERDPGKRATFEALMAAGINFFDTAEIYTAGRSERTLGRCIRDTDTAPVVLTKFFPMPWRLRGRALPVALRNSLERLQLPRADVYLLHYPLPPVAIETWAAFLADAVAAGLAKSVGVSNCSPAQMRRAHAALAARGIPLACNEVEYSLFSRAPEQTGLSRLCREMGVTLIAYRPLAQGMLSGKYSPAHPPTGFRSLLFSRKFLAGVPPVVDVLRRIGEKHGKSVSQVAMNWVICKGALPIPGAKDPLQAKENAGAMGWRLLPEEMAELDALTSRS